MPATTRMRFMGSPKRIPRTVELPVPFLAKSEKTGELLFDPECDVPDEWVEPLLRFGGGGFQIVKAKTARANGHKPAAARNAKPARRRRHYPGMTRPYKRKVTHESNGHDAEGGPDREAR